MGALQKTYIIKTKGDKPPQILLGQDIGGGEVIAIEAVEMPKLVTLSWLIEQTSMKRDAILNRIRQYNKGSDHKHLYDPEEVLPLLTIKKKRAGRPRND